MINTLYNNQVKLLLQLLPDVFKIEHFFIKGGTAINFFIRDVPRLSVDIDLVLGIITERQDALNIISAGMDRIAQSISSRNHSYQINKKKFDRYTVSLLVNSGAATVKIEINTIFRGCVFPCIKREITSALSMRLNMDYHIVANMLSVADIYGGKVCAALDRQHPRDLFDLKILFENEGLTNDIRKAFIIYLAGHDRPIAELLAPKRMNTQKIFESEFRGMTDVSITYTDLEIVQEQLIKCVNNDLTNNERQFLFSMKKGEPDWSLLSIDGIDKLPALQWKLTNIHKMPSNKHEKALEKLKRVLKL